MIKKGDTVQIGKHRAIVERVWSNSKGDQLITVEDTGLWAGAHPSGRDYLASDVKKVEVDNGWCDHCHSYCYGDCQANGATDDNFKDNTPWQKGDDLKEEI